MTGAAVDGTGDVDGADGLDDANGTDGTDGTDSADGVDPRASSRGRLIAAAYFALAAAGLVGTWFFNLAYSGPDYLADWFANPASSSAAIDLIVIVLVAATFYVRESRRLGWRLIVPLLFTVLSIAVALSFALPVFLGLRELRLHRRSAHGTR